LTYKTTFKSIGLGTLIPRKGEVMKRFWHYTTITALSQILLDGEIKPTGHFRLKNTTDDLMLVWFSTNPKWEEAVRKKIFDKDTGWTTKTFSRDDIFRRGVNPVRIEIDGERITVRSWRDLKKEGIVDKGFLRGREYFAMMWGSNPKEWWYCVDPVQISDFLSIGIWNGLRWVDRSRDEFLGA
jgi:hypothetical protein